MLLTFQGFVNSGWVFQSPPLHRAKSNIEQGAREIYKIDLISGEVWDNDLLKRLEVIIDFIKEAINVLDKKGVPLKLRMKVDSNHGPSIYYDYIAELMFNVISSYQ